ncbi:MAG: cytochrome c3 family protein [Actinomycetota bacterium]|nr:cytochrome c3 family protein [Actinomycetota bacterium]
MHIGVAIRLLVCVAAVAFVVLAAAVPVALAYDESIAYPAFGAHSPCTTCHGATSPSGYCSSCHGPGGGFGLVPEHAQGPHDGYTTTSQRCAICHKLHNAPYKDQHLLPGATIAATCRTCHDGTGGKGVYGAIKFRTGADPGETHRVELTTWVPGGDPASGGGKAYAFKGLSNALTCTDCHNAHDTNTVAGFRGERRRVPYSTVGREAWEYKLTNKLLKKRPGPATADINTYGSDWCLACHQGRHSGGTIKNHPVDSALTHATPFTYDNVAKLNSDVLTGVTVLGALGGDHRGYLMPYPRTAQQGTHKPICQQCHEDSRNVGILSGATADAEAFSVSLDGVTAATNPRFQNFPHETVNQGFLVETADNLCLNCHPVAQLP